MLQHKTMAVLVFGSQQATMKCVVDMHGPQMMKPNISGDAQETTKSNEDIVIKHD